MLLGNQSLDAQNNIAKHIIQFSYLQIYSELLKLLSIWYKGLGDNLTSEILRSNKLAIWRMHIDQATESITFDTCSIIMTGLLVFTICRGHWYILPLMAGMKSTLQKSRTYCLLLINGKKNINSIFYIFNIVRKKQFSAPYRNMYNIWKIGRCVECARVSNWYHREMHYIFSEFSSLVSCYTYKLKWTGDTKSADWWLDIIRMYS